MGRLRPRSVFGKRRIVSESISPKSIYIISIATEGDSEEYYFDGISKMDLPNLIVIDRLEKKLTDDGKKDTKSAAKHVIALLDERKERWEEYDAESDELWMVVDRDPQNFKEHKLEEIIAECKEKGYSLALSNPTFELWLLLHLTSLDKYNFAELLHNRKTGKKRFLQKELSRILQEKGFNSYKKDNIQFEAFKGGIKDAILRAKQLKINNVDLVKELGTSVSVLVEKLMNSSEKN
ncbi:MAG: RloB family protein [Bacteroidales bacterium]